MIAIDFEQTLNSNTTVEAWIAVNDRSGSSEQARSAISNSAITDNLQGYVCYCRPL